MSFFGVIFVIVLLLLVLGLFKAAPTVGYAPGGLVTVLLLVLLFLLLTGRI